MAKATVTLGGVPLAASSGVTWRLVTGVAPYVTTMDVHKRQWPALESQIGKPITLKIKNSHDKVTEIRSVYVLHKAPSGNPNIVSFIVADRRWKWEYKLLARDYNVTRKTGDVDAIGEERPRELQQYANRVDFMPHSLRSGDAGQTERWTAREALKDALELVEPGGWRIESFPIEDDGRAYSSETGQFSLQDVVIRDNGDRGIQRLLSYIPGAEVYVDTNGQVVVFDATDIDAAENYYNGLPKTTYNGESAAFIDRTAIRPSSVVVHYQRELELCLDYEDDYSNGEAIELDPYVPYIENVMPTVDDETTITEYDAVTGEEREVTVRAGTWVPFKQLLDAWAEERPAGSSPWTFATISLNWVHGNLESALFPAMSDAEDTEPATGREKSSIQARVQAIKAHFRQTFRINPAYMERISSVSNTRVGVIHPFTGARAPAGVWGQACIVPSNKGRANEMARVVSVGPEWELVSEYRNVDYLRPYRSGKLLVTTAVSPAQVVWRDMELGIFSVDWKKDAYGLTESIIPCNTQNINGETKTFTRDMALQDSFMMGAGFRVAEGTSGFFLAERMQMKVVLTVVPAGPNGTDQFQQVRVAPDDVRDVFRSAFKIQAGEGPQLEVFVAPNELTARFAVADSDRITDEAPYLFGLFPGPRNDPEGEIIGMQLVNGNRFLKNHAMTMAAESLSVYADSIQGTVTTRVPDSGLRLTGNMASSSIRAVTSGVVDAVHQFPGQQRPISRFALMSDSARRLVLRVLTN